MGEKLQMLVRFVKGSREEEKRGKRQRGLMIVVCSTENVSTVAEALVASQFPCVQCAKASCKDAQQFSMEQKRVAVVAVELAANMFRDKTFHCVVNYDFPPTLEDYCSRSERVVRNGSGIAVSFFSRESKHLAAEVVALLERSGMQVSSQLRELASQPGSGKSKQLRTKKRRKNSKTKQQPAK